MVGMFFNPFGYADLFKLVMDLTGSYYHAEIIFYIITAFWFSLFFYFSKTNPITYFKAQIISLKTLVTKIIKKK